MKFILKVLRVSSVGALGAGLMTPVDAVQKSKAAESPEPVGMTVSKVDVRNQLGAMFSQMDPEAILSLVAQLEDEVLKGIYVREAVAYLSDLESQHKAQMEAFYVNVGNLEIPLESKGSTLLWLREANGKSWLALRPVVIPPPSINPTTGQAGASAVIIVLAQQTKGREIPKSFEFHRDAPIYQVESVLENPTYIAALELYALRNTMARLRIADPKKSAKEIFSEHLKNTLLSFQVRGGNVTVDLRGVFEDGKNKVLIKNWKTITEGKGQPVRTLAESSQKDIIPVIESKLAELAEIKRRFQLLVAPKDQHKT